MKVLLTSFFLIVVLVFVGCQSSKTPTEATPSNSHFDQLANVSFPDNQPSQEAVGTLTDELLFQRATQVYLWALPAVNLMAMKEGSEKVFGSGYNVCPSGRNGSMRELASPRQTPT